MNERAAAALRQSAAAPVVTDEQELRRELDTEYLANVIQAKTSLTGHQLYGAARAVHSLVVQRVLQERSRLQAALSVQGVGVTDAEIDRLAAILDPYLWRELSDADATSPEIVARHNEVKEISRGRMRRVVAALTQRGRGVAEGKPVGWFFTTGDKADKLAFVAGDMDPREAHDNGKPYYRAYAMLAAAPEPDRR